MSDKPEHKLTRKELKAPDEFQKIGAQAMPFMVTHQKTIVGGVIGIVVIAGIAGLISELGSKSQDSARPPSRRSSPRSRRTKRW